MIVLFYLCVFRFATCLGDYAFDGKFFYLVLFTFGMCVFPF